MSRRKSRDKLLGGSLEAAGGASEHRRRLPTDRPLLDRLLAVLSVVRPPAPRRRRGIRSRSAPRLSRVFSRAESCGQPQRPPVEPW